MIWILTEQNRSFSPQLLDCLIVGLSSPAGGSSWNFSLKLARQAAWPAEPVGVAQPRTRLVLEACTRGDPARAARVRLANLHIRSGRSRSIVSDQLSKRCSVASIPDSTKLLCHGIFMT